MKPSATGFEVVELKNNSSNLNVNKVTRSAKESRPAIALENDEIMSILEPGDAKKLKTAHSMSEKDLELMRERELIAELCKVLTKPVTTRIPGLFSQTPIKQYFK